METTTATREHPGHVEATSSTGTSPPLLTAVQVAGRWQVSRDHVYELTRRGELPAVKLGRVRRYRLDAVETFEREGGA
jgi:excisionase family DNA binding protein